MKKLLLLAVLSIATAPLALASNARLGSLGQDTNGSYFIKDNRNIFLNPALMAKESNQINVEAGTNSPMTKAEGGLIHTTDMGTIGLHLGRTGMGAQNILQAESDLTISLFNPQNSLELLYARDLGSMVVGGSLLYANSTSDVGETVNLPDSEASLMTLTAGVSADLFDANLTYGLTETAKTEDLASVIREYDGSTSLKLGGVYKLSDMTKISAEIVQVEYGFDDGAGLTGDRSLQTMALNFYNQLAGNEEYFIFYTVGLAQADQTVDYDPAATNDVETSQMYLPIVIGGEAKVKDWLTLRASVKQNTLIDSSETKNGATDLKTSNINDTTVAAGVGLNFGQVTIDSLLEGTSGSAASGKINGTELLANVAFKYTY